MSKKLDWAEILRRHIEAAKKSPAKHLEEEIEIMRSRPVNLNFLDQIKDLADMTEAEIEEVLRDRTEETQ